MESPTTTTTTEDEVINRRDGADYCDTCCAVADVDATAIEMEDCATEGDVRVVGVRYDSNTRAAISTNLIDPATIWWDTRSPVTTIACIWCRIGNC